MSFGPDLNASDSVRVFLDDVEVTVRCGLHPWERFPEHPNRLLVRVEMMSRWPLRAARPDGHKYIDYDRVRAYILGWQSMPHTELLETLLKSLTDFIFEDQNIEFCRVSISKPDIFPETASAGVELSRHRPDAA